MAPLPIDSEPPAVGPHEARRLQQGGSVFIDVREDSEWKAGHAPEARHLPLGQLVDRSASLPKDRQLIMVCRSGHRSTHATEMLRHAGFDAVNLEGGMQAWAAAGFAIQTDGGDPGTVA